MRTYSSELTNIWRDIIQEKKNGDFRLLYLVDFNDTQRYFLENVYIGRMQLFSNTYYRISMVYLDRTYEIEAWKFQNGREEIKADKNLPFNEGQLKSIVEWLLEINERAN